MMAWKGVGNGQTRVLSQPLRVATEEGENVGTSGIYPMNARHALHALRFYLKCFILIENIK